MRLDRRIPGTACLLLCCSAGLAQPLASESGVTDAMLQDPAEGDWLMWRRTLNGWGYSPLAQIDRSNVATLQLVWDIPLNEGSVQEGTPLVHDGVLYMPHPGDVVTAHDARTGKQLWEHRREIPEDLGDYIPATETERSLALYGDTILFTSNDDYIVGLDAGTGTQRWQTQILDYRRNPAQQSSGPVVIRGKAISGRGCMPAAGPDACVITAHDAATGKELWRLNTIQKPGEGGEDTWGGLPWEQRWHVGAWMMPSYDPELDLIYFGTSVTAPAPKFMLAGNDKTYLYHNSTLAIDPDDGHIVWHYQHLVDHWDLDHPFERLLVDTVVAPDPAEVAWINPAIEPGKVYKVLTGIPGKTGVVYTLDRSTGEFLWARPTVHQNVLASIDGTTGKATVNPAAEFHAKGDVAEICPALTGGKNWWAGAYSPLTNAMYYGLQNTCADVTVIQDKPDVEALYGTSGRDKLAPGRSNIGTIHAISAETGKTLWTYDMPGTALSLVTTGGGLVIGGDLQGNVRAFDQATGAVLWQVNLGSSVTGYPISFAVDGRQYLAVSTGSSVTTAGHRRLFPELSAGIDNHLYVFALP
ncbi:MAG: pyrroloquinoline quinone-dependent dehydrogenase [Pseudohongiellaceae bacterium]|jgi:PQQ-dependent dehydrogenase (methanol/ethanol family)